MKTYTSNCCGARVEYLDKDTMTGFCSDCYEGCGAEEEVEEIPGFEGTNKELNKLTILSPNQTLNMLGTKEEFEKSNY